MASHRRRRPLASPAPRWTRSSGRHRSQQRLEPDDPSSACGATTDRFLRRPARPRSPVGTMAPSPSQEDCRARDGTPVRPARGHAEFGASHCRPQQRLASPRAFSIVARSRERSAEGPKIRLQSAHRVAVPNDPAAARSRHAAPRAARVKVTPLLAARCARPRPVLAPTNVNRDATKASSSPK